IAAPGLVVFSHRKREAADVTKLNDYIIFISLSVREKYIRLVFFTVCYIIVLLEAFFGSCLAGAEKFHAAACRRSRWRKRGDVSPDKYNQARR
ncbi:MAG: hypothetical protein LBK91_01840, partial [Synergistaceae bacterium]|nr:hypothetical protein [Synergistaceae bacterium]